MSSVPLTTTLTTAIPSYSEFALNLSPTTSNQASGVSSYAPAEVKACDSMVFSIKFPKEFETMLNPKSRRITPIHNVPNRENTYADFFSSYGSEFLSIITPKMLSTIPEKITIKAPAYDTTAKGYHEVKDASFNHKIKAKPPFSIDFVEPAIRGIHQINIDGQSQFCPFVALRLIWKDTLKNKTVVEKEVVEWVYICTKVQVDDLKQIRMQTIFQKAHSGQPIIRTLNDLSVLLSNQELPTDCPDFYNDNILHSSASMLRKAAPTTADLPIAEAKGEKDTHNRQ